MKYTKQQYDEAHNILYGCNDCGQMGFTMIIIKDNLWRKISNFQKEYLCFKCMEKRLGRKITIKDLKKCFITNQIIAYRKLKIGEK